MKYHIDIRMVNIIQILFLSLNNFRKRSHFKFWSSVIQREELRNPISHMANVIRPVINCNKLVLISLE